MKFKVIACKALFRELSLIGAKTKSVLDITYMQRALHDTPELLQKALQEEINKIDSGDDIHSNKKINGQDFDAILLGYGLCSNGISGLTSKKYKLVVPRCDDCIALYLGSYKKYREFFDKHPGTYWYNASWIENGYTPSEQSDKAKFLEYAELYGQDNAEYLINTENTVKNYNTAAYVSWDELSFPQHEKYTEEAAKYFNWDYHKVYGSSSWLADFLEGNHDERFAIAQPGESFAQDFDGKVIKSCPFAAK